MARLPSGKRNKCKYSSGNPQNNYYREGCLEKNSDFPLKDTDSIWQHISCPLLSEFLLRMLIAHVHPNGETKGMGVSATDYKQTIEYPRYLAGWNKNRSQGVYKTPITQSTLRSRVPFLDLQSKITSYYNHRRIERNCLYWILNKLQFL